MHYNDLKSAPARIRMICAARVAYNKIYLYQKKIAGDTHAGQTRNIRQIQSIFKPSTSLEEK